MANKIIIIEWMITEFLDHSACVVLETVIVEANEKIKIYPW